MMLKRFEKRIAHLFIIFLIIQINGFAANWTEAAQDPTPGPIPDHIILTICADPTSSQAVTWRTDLTIEKPLAELAVAEASPNFTQNAQQYTAETQHLTIDDYTANYHSVTFTNLEPNTLYAYRVGSEDNWSAWFQFRTAAREKEPFRFIYVGDGQNALLSLWSRAIRAAYSTAPDSRFIINAGDLVSLADNYNQWNEWHLAAGWINAMVPIVPAPGNHGYYHGHGKKRYLTDFWSAQFTLPENGIEEPRESSYYFDYQGIRVVILNSNEKIDEQADWLADVLRDNPNDWTVASFHHPIYSGARGRDQEKIRKAWQPLFRKYGVDLVLNGHDHTYARGYNIDAEDGIVYVVSVSGPKQYDLTDDRWMDRAAENTQLFHVVSIDGDRLNFKSYTVTGQIYDEFDIQHNPTGPNTIIDKHDSSIPERRFENTP